MRYAKSRSTRSKLRSYFRAKQNESLREAGKILLLDYLWVHGPLIERSSFMPEGTKIPTILEGMADFLPGKTRFEDIDDLLIAIGKKHDRTFLHTVMSKLFLVPQSVLVEAEKDRTAPLPNSITTAVYESRKLAKDAERAAASSLEIRTDVPELSNASPLSAKEAVKMPFRTRSRTLSTQTLSIFVLSAYQCWVTKSSAQNPATATMLQPLCTG